MFQLFLSPRRAPVRTRSERAPALGADDTVVFVHIPKTAGTSFKSVLKGWFGAGLMVFDGHDREAFASAWRARPERPTALAGHFLHDLPTAAPDLKPWRISLVRDPVERLVSLYKHARETPDHRLHPAACALDLEGFHRHALEAPAARRRTMGVQCYFLTGERRFEAARPALDRYRLLAPMEAFDDFLAHAATLLDKPLLPAPVRNRRTGTPLLEDAAARLADRIRQDHVEDQRLYEHVRARFARQASGAGGGSS